MSRTTSHTLREMSPPLRKLSISCTLHLLFSQNRNDLSQQFLELEEQEALSQQLQDGGAAYRSLPATLDEADDDADDNDVSDDGENPDFLFAVPPGFGVVGKPESLPTDIDGLFVMLLFNVGWCLGKFTEYKPLARKYKFVITYNDGSRPTALQLKDYYEGNQAPETPNTEDQSGLWVLLKKAAVQESDMEVN